jgi:translation elongation factor EF-Ts
MQVVGAAPKFLDRSAVSAEALDAERSVLREQALKSGGWSWVPASAQQCLLLLPIVCALQA